MLITHNSIADIVDKIQIDLDFSIRHPDYPPLELDADTIALFQRISPQLQTKYLTVRVRNYLYDIYFSHSSQSLTEIDAAAKQSLQVKNNLVNGVDIDFERQLRQSNRGRGYLDPDWELVAHTDDGESIVVKDGLHLSIEPKQHLPQQFQAAAIGDIVSIYLPPNLVGRDTYIIVGNAGQPKSSDSIELYFNFNPPAAVSIAQQLTERFNRANIPFQFAILHDPDLFYRYDTGTLCLDRVDYLAMQTFGAEIYQTHQADFSPQIPLFCKQLAPGLGLAEVPTTSVEFGMQRCELLAMGLLAAMEQELTLAAERLSVISQQFTNAGIDWLQPYLNPTHRDCYDVYPSQ